MVGEVAASDSGSEAEVAIAREAAGFVQLLLRGIKNIGIYRHAEERYPEYLQPAYDALSGLLDTHGALPLKLQPFSLSYRRHVVYEDEDRENLTYKFYRDGVRYLVFRPGIPADELLRFVLLAMESYSDRALANEDMVTRFWKEEFQFIEHVVVEGFGFAEISEEEVEIEVDKIVAYLRHQLAAKSDDVTRFARLSASDLELELNDIEQVRGGIVSGRPASDEDKSRLQAEILHEQRSRIFAKMVLILFQVLELEARESDHEMLLESVTQVLDLLLVSDDVRGAIALRHRFDKVMDSDLPESRRKMVRAMREEFRRRMLEPQRLAQVGQYLQLAKDLDEGAVQAYFDVCGEDELIPLVEMLAGMERPAGRRILIEVLATIGRDHVEVFARRLDNNASNVVKDMLAVIHVIDPPDKVSIIAKCLDHPNIMIRLEGLKGLAKSDDPRSLEYIESALEDEDPQLRLGALRALATRDPVRAAKRFIKTMQAPHFERRERRERVTVATALGETRTQEALDYFAGVFGQRTHLFSRTKVADQKLLAITGLAAMRSVAAFKLLNRELQDHRHGREVLEACHRAAVLLKERIEKERSGHV